MGKIFKEIKNIGLDEGILYLEHTKAVDSIRSGTIKLVPFKNFPSSIHESGESGIYPLDISNELEVSGPATSPSLCANFIRILQNDNFKINFNSSIL